MKSTAPIQLSVIVPTLNESRGLVEQLQRLQAFRASGIEVLVVDGGSDDGTVDIAGDWVDQVLHSPAGRAIQMNCGARRASGAYLLFLHADTVLPEQLPQMVIDWLRGDVAWGFFKVRLSGNRWPLRIIERFIGWRSRLTGVSTGDQCQFVQKRIFEQVGGFPELPLMEDVALSKRLRRLARPRVEATPVITSSRRWERAGIVRTVMLMWGLRLAYFLGVNPRRLAAAYYPPRRAGRGGQKAAHGL